MNAVFLRNLIATLLIFLLSESCSNVFPTSTTKTDDALLVDAQIAMNTKDYTKALAKFKLMSATYLAQREVLALNASAYAGRCGLDFLGLVTNFTNIGTSTVLGVLYKNGVKAVVAQENDCKSAEALLNSIPVKNSSEYLLLGLLEFQKIGVILGQYADQGGTGTVDAGFDPCLTTKGTAPAATGLPVVEAQEFSASLMIALNSLSSSGVSAFSSSLGSLKTYCASIKAILGGADPCSQTTPSSFTNQELQALMGLVKTNFFGIGTCADTSLVTCTCAVYP
jgi:hypothetical protein